MRLVYSILLATAAAVAAVPAQAQTQDDVGINSGDVLVRLRGIVVAPTGPESAGPIQPLSSAVLGASAGAKVDNSVMPEIDVTYMATPNIGVELIASSMNNGIRATGALSGLGKVGSTWVLPPTLTLQYHFLPHSHIRPYLGVGVNYTIFYSSKTNGVLNDTIDGLDLSGIGLANPAAGAYTHLGLSDSVGYALQGGLDVDVTKNVFLNFDIKYLDINTTGYLTTPLSDGTSLVNTTRVHLDPLVIGVGVGFKF